MDIDNDEAPATDQKSARAACLEAILRSSSRRKLIVAGAGTGKTYTFRKLLELKARERNVAMTFIRKLVSDMSPMLAGVADVNTFHAFCKGQLHKFIGSFEIFPALEDLVTKDAKLIGLKVGRFVSKIQSIDERGGDIKFYLARGDYYGVVSFDDSVYRLYKILEQDPSKTPKIDNLVVDEYQDFNRLEVALIAQLQQSGNVLIVGDDDQAIYSGRSASPEHLRILYADDSYEKFPLPFCSRCPSVVVEASKDLIREAVAKGHLLNRIDKPFECYLESKAVEDKRYPRIERAQVSLVSSVAKYVSRELKTIPADEIAESYEENYPTALVVGPQHFLREVDRRLREEYGDNVIYTPSHSLKWDSIDAYRFLAVDPESNLGWRLLIDLYLDVGEQVRIVTETYLRGTAIRKLLSPAFVNEHLVVMGAVDKAKEHSPLSEEENGILTGVFGTDFEHFIESLTNDEEEKEIEINTSLPKILLTTFVGCKGLSAGHVFIVGANNGNIPKDSLHPTDIEISQFMVALTRTRKRCHIVSNKWFASVNTSSGYAKPDFIQSTFVSWIARERYSNRGYLKNADLD